MKKYNKSIGFYGEDLSAKFLEKEGYSILEKNFNCSSGEIDIIAIKGEIISFIEWVFFLLFYSYTLKASFKKFNSYFELSIWKLTSITSNLI